MRIRPNRPFRRRGILGGAIAAGLMGRLAEANRLFDVGRPAEAASAFAELAQEAAARGHPQRAAQLHLRAGEGFAQAGDGDGALTHARAALAIFNNLGRPDRARRVGARAVQSLRAAGLHAQAEALERELTGLPASAPDDEAEPAAPPRGRLPTDCPKCGGPVRSGEVEWIDEHSAECVYCGSVVPTQG
jgi:hypothetical protein